jgi:hypothetical protein
MKLTSINKFIVAAVGVGVAFGLFDDETAQTIVGVATALLVYIVPND